MLMCVPQSEQIWEILKDIFKDLYSDRKIEQPVHVPGLTTIEQNITSQKLDSATAWQKLSQI